MEELKKLLESMGYKNNGSHNFYKENHKFLICLYFQWSSSQSYYFVNLGIQPIFSHSISGAINEIDCILRTRINFTYHIQSNVKLTPQNLKEFESVMEEIESQYRDMSNIFTSREPEKDLEQDPLLSKFTITKVNLCRLYVEYYSEINEVALAKSFATYGLSIASKMAVTPRKYFRKYLDANA